MYKLHGDKAESFQCKLKLEGASLSKTTCRLVVESHDWTLLFNGEIDGSGEVTIPIKKLKAILPEGTTGTLRLEVIADQDTIFTPWQESFRVEVSKKVVVESVKSSSNVITTPKVSVITTTPIASQQKVKDSRLVVQFANYLKAHKITLANISKNRTQLAGLLESFVVKNKVPKKQVALLIKNVSDCAAHLR